MVCILQTSQEQKSQNMEIYNPAEASLVYTLLQVMQPYLSTKTVAIITPYQRQKIYLEEKLFKFKGIINLCINTIDGFQVCGIMFFHLIQMSERIVAFIEVR